MLPGGLPSAGGARASLQAGEGSPGLRAGAPEVAVRRALLRGVPLPLPERRLRPRSDPGVPEVRRDLLYAALALDEAKRRRADDPLALFEPFKAQADFLDCTLDEAWYSGANRIGKSDALAAWGSSFLRFGNPNPKAAYCGEGIVIYDKAVNVW